MQPYNQPTVTIHEFSKTTHPVWALCPLVPICLIVKASNYIVSATIDIISSNGFPIKVEEKVLTAKEVALILRLSVKTVRDKARAGFIPAYWLDGKPTKPGEKKTVRFLESQIIEYVKKNYNGYND